MIFLFLFLYLAFQAAFGLAILDFGMEKAGGVDEDCFLPLPSGLIFMEVKCFGDAESLSFPIYILCFLSASIS